MDQLKAAKELHPRRLSSTPIKSPPKESLQRCSTVGSRDALACKSSSMNSDAFVVKTRDDSLKNKFIIDDKEEQDSGREDEHKNSDVSSYSSSDSEDQGVVVKPPLLPNTLCFPAQSDPPYDQRTYQDEDSCRDSDSDVIQADDGDSDSILSNADESTLIEDKYGQQGKVVFDDNDTWNDLEVTAVNTPDDSREVSNATSDAISPPERTLSRKVAVSKAVELDKGRDVYSANREPGSPPPASQLMTRLFPSLKPKAQNAPVPPPPPPAASAGLESKMPEVETGETNPGSLLNIMGHTSIFTLTMQSTSDSADLDCKPAMRQLF